MDFLKSAAKVVAEDKDIRSSATNLGKEAAAKYQAAESGGVSAVVGDKDIKEHATQLGKDAYTKVSANNTNTPPEESSER